MRHWIKDKTKRLLCLYKLKDVFTPNTAAKVTYVERINIEDQIERDLSLPGRAIILYGHSGSGKSTLIRRKFKQLKINFIKVQCEHDTTYEDILLRSIDQLGVFYVSQKSTNRKYHVTNEGKAAYKQLSISIKSSREESKSETSLRMVQPQVNTQKLAELLGAVKGVLILEDFHKVTDEHKVRIADSLKVFIDCADTYPDLKVICIGAVDTPRELILQSADLYPRVSEVFVPLLNDQELKDMIRKGCSALNIEMSPTLIEKIVFYSNNIASLAHQMCYDICYANKIYKRRLFCKHIGDDKFRHATDAFIERHSDSLKRIYDTSTKDKVGWYVLKTISTYGRAISFSDIRDRVNRTKETYEPIVIQNKLDELISEDVNILRYDKNSEKYSISTPLWGAFLKTKLATEKALKEKLNKNKKNRNLSLANTNDIDSIVELSFYNFIDRIEPKVNEDN